MSCCKDKEACKSESCKKQAETPKPKPCCVCKDEKSARDECLLINGVDSPKCDTLIQSYKTCMKGFGFEI